METHLNFIRHAIKNILKALKLYITTDVNCYNYYTLKKFKKY